MHELARGLAYWVGRYVPLPGDAALQGTRTVGEAVAALPREPLPEIRNVTSARDRFNRIDSFAGYGDALEAVAPLDPQWLLSEMTSEFAGVYLAHDEVSPVPLIHGVTAPAAVRLVLPHLPGEMDLPTVTGRWQMHVALPLAFTGDNHGEGPLKVDAERAQLPFDELAARATEHGDEHVIKFAEACLREHGLRPDPRYAAAVEVALQRIPPR
ncbi:MAG: hypothetical protein QOG10_3102 [Kribbellaceae bacterium]|nr:hypothetical protein [Kribbellaceae bacterium]